MILSDKNNDNSILIIYLLLLFLIIVYYLAYYIRNPTELLEPYNKLIENIHEKRVFYDQEQKIKIFPTSQILEENWILIRKECLNLLSIFKQQNIKIDNIGEKYIQQDKEFYEGWSTIVLKDFNNYNEANMVKCPILNKILKSDDNITTAFFSILEPGKTISSHYGPFKGILRYHLALFVPPREAGDCFISVDDQIYEWTEGEGVLFDETYLHFVKNDTDFTRIILFLDVKRPFDSFFLTKMNNFMLYLMSIAPY